MPDDMRPCPLCVDVIRNDKTLTKPGAVLQRLAGLEYYTPLGLLDHLTASHDVSEVVPALQKLLNEAAVG